MEEISEGEGKELGERESHGKGGFGVASPCFPFIFFSTYVTKYNGSIFINYLKFETLEIHINIVFSTNY